MITPSKDLNPMGKRMQVTSAVACLAVAAAPLGIKIPLPAAGFTLSEILLLFATLLLAPTAIRELRSGDIWPPVFPSIPFVLCGLLSTLNAPDPIGAVKELGQIGLYCTAGVWVFAFLLRSRTTIRALSIALRCALGAALTVAIAFLSVESHAFGKLMGTPNGFSCCVMLLGFLLLASRRVSQSDRFKILDKSLVVLTVFCCSMVVIHASREQMPAPSEGAPPAVIAHRHLEGNAAVSVLSEYPLFGLGIGNYQLRIGEFYQGMPKENTLVQGAQIGYGVIVASVGLLGLASFLYWILSVWALTTKAQSPIRALQMTLLLLLVWAFFTPVLIGQVLLPLIVAHGVAWNLRSSAYV